MSIHKKRVTFKLVAPNAQQVFLAGSFNDWSLDGDALKQSRSGIWKKEKNLALGIHEYKFIVDGKWVLDPECPVTVPNQHGTANNVLEVKSEGKASKKEAYVAKIKVKLDKWQMEIDKLETKAAQARNSTKAKYLKQIELLRSMRKEFELKFEELRQTGGQAWEGMKDGVENAWKALYESIKSAASKFK